MSELLDLRKLYRGLEQEHGQDALATSDMPSASEATLISPDGLPLTIGWYENEHTPISQLRPGPDDKYALVAYPETPKRMRHRLIVEQPKNFGERIYSQRPKVAALLIEEDDENYLYWYDHRPKLIREKSLSSAELALHCRGLTVGSFVVDAAVGHRHKNFARYNRFDVQAVREHGRSIVEDGDVLTEVDAQTLARYAKITPTISS